jgi:anti-sigma-K factor RskA
MRERDEIDVLAGEYVLGTLDAAERAAVAARRRREARLDAAIAAWEQRLGPLSETLPAVTPAAGLWPRIEARLDREAAGSETAERIARLERSPLAWRRAAIAATALAACLLVVIGAREVMRPQAARTYVAVFQKDDASPAFLLTVDLDTRMLSIRAVAAEPQPGKSYQLWIASEKLGPAPQSLGLIEARSGVTQRELGRFDRALVEKATFGVSLEPEGGSPTGRPTGPAFHAKLIETGR